VRILLASLLLAGRPVAPSPAREYRIDAGHSDIAFSIGFLGHAVRGRFDGVKGTISYAANDPSASSITVVIATKSISTGSAHRDEHLRSPDFFDGAKYPFIVFKSTSVARRGDSAVVTGSLSMHGVTRTVAIPFREMPPVADPHGSSLLFFSGHLRIARKDFGILGGAKYNDWFDELRSATMSDTVDITLDVAGWDPDVDRTPNLAAAVQRVEQVGLDATLARLRTMPRDSLAASGYQIEQVARGLLAHRRTSEAIALMRFNAETLENDPAVQASFARLFEVTGQLDSARVHAGRALALDSLDTRAQEIARRLGAVAR
jgi:polyisoprenoid-binding protein YceI